MTEESFQQARKVMQKANYMRGIITVRKADVGKWSRINDEHDTAKTKNQLEKSIERLKEARNKFADLKFPDSDIIKEVTRCKECGCKIADGNNYCGECLCEDDSDY